MILARRPKPSPPSSNFGKRIPDSPLPIPPLDSLQLNLLSRTYTNHVHLHEGFIPPPRSDGAIAIAVRGRRVEAHGVHRGHGLPGGFQVRDQLDRNVIGGSFPSVRDRVRPRVAEYAPDVIDVAVTHAHHLRRYDLVEDRGRTHVEGDAGTLLLCAGGCGPRVRLQYGRRPDARLGPYGRYTEVRWRRRRRRRRVDHREGGDRDDSEGQEKDRCGHGDHKRGRCMDDG
mmetsp:Transcript_9149/g.27489  ORF Transcript_9149/g.27489 Transcript_9149/m.27489 type:complete len:228 (-) Transcript_9149:19-702(-)